MLPVVFRPLAEHGTSEAGLAKDKERFVYLRLYNATYSRVGANTRRCVYADGIVKIPIYVVIRTRKKLPPAPESRYYRAGNYPILNIHLAITAMALVSGILWLARIF